MEKRFKEGDIVAFYPTRNGVWSEYDAKDGSLAKVIGYNTPVWDDQEYLYVEWIHEDKPKHCQENGGYFEDQFRLYQRVEKVSTVCSCDMIDVWNFGHSTNCPERVKR